MTHMRPPQRRDEGHAGPDESDEVGDFSRMVHPELAHEVAVPWRATLENGEIDIDVGEEGCTDPVYCPSSIWFDVWQDGAPAGADEGM